MRARTALLSATLLMTSAGAVAKAPPTFPVGLYSNVRMSGETGDLGGMEANFFEDAGKHMVEFVWCEGWCNQTYKAEVTSTDDFFAFEYVEIYESDNGHIENERHFIIRPLGKNKIKILAWQGGAVLVHDGKPQTLKRAKQPFGISVANSNDLQGN